MRYNLPKYTQMKGDEAGYYRRDYLDCPTCLRRFIDCAIRFHIKSDPFLAV